jgi:ubiquinone/menaquinone biosynthesis C-methylase UbiE
MRTGWYRRLFAWAMARESARHSALVADYKRALLGSLRGTVLEIGPGTGPNLRYYPRDIQWIGVEPNIHMHPYLRQEAQRLGVPVELRTGTVEQLAAADNSVDAVVSTLVLCSVTDLPGALREIRRVLRPGGRFVFIEHVAAPQGSRLRRVQQVIRPAWQIMGDGCQPDREIGSAIARSGFAQTDYQHFDAPLPIVGPHIAGSAVKPIGAGETRSD